MWREVYRKTINPEMFVGSEDVLRLMSQVGPSESATGDGLEATVARAGQWSEDRWVAYERLIGEHESDRETAERLVRSILTQSTPMASTLGCCLQGLSAPGVFEDSVQLTILTLLADDLGVGRPASSRFDEFQLLLKRHDLPEVSIAPHDLSALQAVQDHMFALPAVLLALSRRGDRFAPELCGIDLVLRSIGIHPCWRALRERSAQSINWARLDLRSPGCYTGLREPLAAARSVVAEYGALGASTQQRMESAAAWVYQAMQQWDQHLLERCQASVDPRQAMANLVRARAREGAVYHHDFALEGRSLATWLRESLQDPGPFLDALSRSKLVRPGDAGNSPLVNGLVSARGPMFRVFSPTDLATVSRWIDTLPAAPTRDEPPAPRAAREDTTAAAPHPPTLGSTTSAQEPSKPRNIREAYFLLQGRALAPGMRDFATSYAQKWLRLARQSLDKTDRSLPREWPAEGLRPWLLAQHDKHDSDFAATGDVPVPPRESVIDSTLQLAPLTLIDGAWLQGFTDPFLASSRLGFPLFETYWDELGNGDPELNHPRIYRSVLREMGIELPPTASRQFAEDGRFRDSSFRLPVYWLCLGKLPITRMPEILGMNLAMELSGVGGTYRSARRFLKHYGFSTQFVDIHNTIDNVSTGHSAWAADAIDTYMRGHTTTGDPGSSTAEWERIRVGYESLAPLRGKMSRFFEYRFPRARRKEPAVHCLNGSLFHHTPLRTGN